MSNRDKLIKSGVKKSDISELDKKVEVTVDAMLEKYDYEPNDKEGLHKHLQEQIYTHICNPAHYGADKNLSDKFYGIKSDFDKAPEGHAQQSLSVIIGSAVARNSNMNEAERDLLHLTNRILEDKYGRR